MRFGFIGVWKIPCALGLLAPRFPRVKEWPIAGAFFNYTGAAASWLLLGMVLIDGLFYCLGDAGSYYGRSFSSRFITAPRGAPMP